LKYLLIPELQYFGASDGEPSTPGWKINTPPPKKKHKKITSDYKKNNITSHDFFRGSKKNETIFEKNTKFE
jgi:hypothetical protein